MSSSDNVELLKTLASETRLDIINLLISEPDGLRFIDIANALKIYPSTLEDHLKRLVERKMIVHWENRYLANINTERASWIVSALVPIRNEAFFATHRLTIGDLELRNKIQSLNFEIYSDLLSIMSKASETLFQGIETCFLGGALDMNLEQGFFELLNPSLKSTHVEAVFTREGLEDLRRLDGLERIIDAMDLSQVQLYVIENCDFVIGGSERGGLLFLPQNNSKVDFNSCLYFEDSAGIEWLRAVFEFLRTRSDKIGTEALIE